MLTFSETESRKCEHDARRRRLSSASSVLSVSNCRITRPRLAPKGGYESRSLFAGRRICANRRLATLAHATIRISATAASRTKQGGAHTARRYRGSPRSDVKHRDVIIAHLPREKLLPPAEHMALNSARGCDQSDIRASGARSSSNGSQPTGFDCQRVLGSIAGRGSSGKGEIRRA